MEQTSWILAALGASFIVFLLWRAWARRQSYGRGAGERGLRFPADNVDRLLDGFYARQSKREGLHPAATYERPRYPG